MCDIIITEVPIVTEDAFRGYARILAEAYPGRRPIMRFVREIVERPDCRLFFVIDADANVIGAALLTKVISCDGYSGSIKDFALSFAWKGKGVERALLEVIHLHGTLYMEVERFEFYEPVAGIEPVLRSFGYEKIDGSSRFVYAPPMCCGDK